MTQTDKTKANQEGTMKPIIQAYDVLQVLRGSEWLDYATLRTEEEFTLASLFVERGQDNTGLKAKFRVRRPGFGPDKIIL